MKNEKITDEHLGRTAVVYVRQSSGHQVRHNKESQRRQYELRERARQLGFARVEVIDEDLGRSGSGKVARPGFGRLLDLVCKGEVGAVLAFEASRLARNNRDWHHLIDLCTMTDTIVIDHDGVYNPRMLNDRLLLGLKGTMSEFELGLLRQRAQQALREKIARGEVLTMVPVGYRRTKENGIEMDPDRQVQQAIRGVFAKFNELGSARQVLLWYRQEEIPLPTLGAGEGRAEELVWKAPVMNRILSVLKNPCYAGAFVYGRRQRRTTIVNGRTRQTSGHFVPREQWEVLLLGHHDGYISWSEYERNQELLRENMAMNGKMRSAVKRGPALLGGLVRCGRCGRAMHVYYSGTKGQVARYYCKGANLNHGTALCISIGALKIDQAVSAAAHETLRPGAVSASLQAWEQSQKTASAKAEALQLALEKMRYEADRARRQYDAVDPENRLVAAELESRWNAKLEEVSRLAQRIATETEQFDTLQDGQRQRLMTLGQDVELLWNHKDAAVELKKRILRTLLKEVVIDLKEEDHPEVVMKLHWSGGVHTELRVPKNRAGHHGRQPSADVVELVRDLALTCDDAAVASILNRRGLRTGTGKAWTSSRVQSLRRTHGIPAHCNEETRTWITLDQTADVLQVSRGTVRKLIRAGVIPATQSTRCAPWVIDPSDLQTPEVRSVIEKLKKTGKICIPQKGEQFPSMTDNESQM